MAFSKPRYTPTVAAQKKLQGPSAADMAKPAAKPAAKPKPMSVMDKIRADKGLMGTIRSDAAELRKPAQKAAPKAAASKKSSGLSATKSYNDYKKLMGD